MADFCFEKSLKRLEEITNILENSELSLDEMIKLYTDGVELSAKCSAALDDAKIKISRLSGASNE